MPLPKRETREILGDGGKVLAAAEYLGDVLDGVSRVFSTAGVLTQELTYRAGQLWGGPVSTDGLELGISISDLFSSSSLLIRAPRGFPAARSAAQAAEGSE